MATTGVETNYGALLDTTHQENKEVLTSLEVAEGLQEGTIEAYKYFQTEMLESQYHLTLIHDIHKQKDKYPDKSSQIDTLYTKLGDYWGKAMDINDTLSLSNITSSEDAVSFINSKTQELNTMNEEIDQAVREITGKGFIESCEGLSVKDLLEGKDFGDTLDIINKAKIDLIDLHMNRLFGKLDKSETDIQVRISTGVEFIEKFGGKIGPRQEEIKIKVVALQKEYIGGTYTSDEDLSTKTDTIIAFLDKNGDLFSEEQKAEIVGAIVGLYKSYISMDDKDLGDKISKIEELKLKMGDKLGSKATEIEEKITELKKEKERKLVETGISRMRRDNVSSNISYILPNLEFEDNKLFFVDALVSQIKTFEVDFRGDLYSEIVFLQNIKQKLVDGVEGNDATKIPEDSLDGLEEIILTYKKYELLNTFVDLWVDTMYRDLDSSDKAYVENYNKINSFKQELGSLKCNANYDDCTSLILPKMKEIDELGYFTRFGEGIGSENIDKYILDINSVGRYDSVEHKKVEIYKFFNGENQEGAYRALSTELRNNIISPDFYKPEEIFNGDYRAYLTNALRYVKGKSVNVNKVDEGKIESKVETLMHDMNDINGDFAKYCRENKITDVEEYKKEMVSRYVGNYVFDTLIKNTTKKDNENPLITYYRSSLAVKEIVDTDEIIEDKIREIKISRL